MSLPDLAIFLVALAAGASAALRVHRAPGRPERAGPAASLLVGLAAAFVALEIAALWLAQPADPWNNARLTPAIALHHGFPLYYPLPDGPVLSTVVGPVAFLAYWPVGFFHVSPTGLILLASALNLAVCAALGFALVRCVSENPRTRMLGWLVGAQLALFYPSLRYSLACIHADAPALLLGGLGAGLMIFSRTVPAWPRNLLAALCLTLAVWAKQSIAPIFVAVAIVTALNHGWAAAGRLLAASVIVGATVSAGFVGWLGYAELRDNMFAVPARHPWHQMSLATGEIFNELNAVGPAAHFKVLLAAALHLLRENWLVVAVLLGAVLGHLRAPDRRGLWPRTPWAAWLLIAVCLVPTAALGRTKVGGAVNHESFVIFFLVAAFVCWLLAQRDEERSPRAGLLAAALAVLSLVNFPRALEYPGWTAAWDNQSELAYRYDRRHPGAVYFPWNPLTSLLAEGRLEHFDYGVFDRNLGGAEVSPAHLAAGLPSPRPVLASYLAHHDYILHRYFPDYVVKKPDPELPGWTLYGPPVAPAP